MNGGGADPRALHRALTGHLAPASAAWLATALHDAEATTTSPGGIPAWERHFASAGRHCRPGAGHAGAGDVAEAARVLILHAARPDAPALTRLYTRGSAAERRAVLFALPLLPDLGPGAVPLVQDALRANDTRLTAAALGPYAATHLPPDSWRQALLKCLFTGVPLAAVASLAERAAGDAELARMLTDYAAERTAAGRPVPGDLHHALALTGAAAPPAPPAKEP
ncbi:EboA domain-containing protein [Streptomyces sp. DSM 42041]|uniref:EboA domain-containing protein n=1 Tax=Streptomyces hazeniae TaxID=3075538 RepID=A0ABU2NSY8_9ACTN|nr:EboA domain-containing protein [Streptomyces sp. DSM 42041]MDT0380090.1 EboA domain-containing protein [Streptomyces sp. DSM 42041]